MHNAIKLPQGWFDHTTTSNFNLIRLCKVVDRSSSQCQPLVITHTITVQRDLAWKVYVHDREVSICPALSSMSPQLNETSVMELVKLVDRLGVCPGHPESKFVAFVESRKGKHCNRAGDVVAFIDHHAPVCLNGESFPCTVRNMKCDMLVHGGKCRACSVYRRTLGILHDRWCKRDSESSVVQVVTLIIAT